MKRRFLPFIFLILLIASSITACKGLELPKVVALEESLNQIITSKGEGYDFLEDEQYMSKMKKLVQILVDREIIKKEHYEIGNLDDDNIPELVIFRERDPKDVKDQGALEVYGFNGGKYSLISRIPMNYDNSNYQLVIGRISPKQNGVLLNNQAGSQSGITYGFILKEGKLIDILNEKKVNLVSVTTENEIRDIDGDGVLEFSIYTLDPESREENVELADKILYWYRWDGRDGVELVKYEKIRNKDGKEAIKSEDKILEEANRLVSSQREGFLAYLRENKASLSTRDMTNLLIKYFNSLNEEAKAKTSIINSLISKYSLGTENLLEKSGLSIDRLNDLAYLNREKVLSAEGELKEHLINNRKLGYKLYMEGNQYAYTIDYQLFLDSFGDCILREYRDYFRVLALNINEPFMVNGSLMIALEKLAERLILIDNYYKTYPYSSLREELRPIYNSYLNAFLYGSINNPVFDEKSGKIKEEVLEQFKELKKKYAQSYLGDIIADYLEKVEANGLKFDANTKKAFKNRYSK